MVLVPCHHKKMYLTVTEKAWLSGWQSKNKLQPEMGPQQLSIRGMLVGPIHL